MFAYGLEITDFWNWELYYLTKLESFNQIEKHTAMSITMYYASYKKVLAKLS